jgi:hypothetical protein
VNGLLTLRALLRRSLEIHGPLSISLTWARGSRVGTTTSFGLNHRTSLKPRVWADDDLNVWGGCDADLVLLQRVGSCEDLWCVESC